MAGRVPSDGPRGPLDLAALRRWTWATFGLLAGLAVLAWLLEWRR